MSGRADPHRVSRRCIRACTRCHAMKVRCSGTVPCTRCQRKRESCILKPEEARVSITRSYLKTLEDRAQEVQRSDPHQTSPPPDDTILHHTLLSPLESASASEPAIALENEYTDQTGSRRDQSGIVDNRSSNQDREGAGGSPPEPSPAEFNRNPLIDSGETFARDPHGKYWYMGPTSSWAFCRRVLAIIGSRMPRPEPPVDPWDLQTLDLTWNPIGLTEQPDVDNLPSYDYALFLLSTVEYHLGPFKVIINHASFHRHMERFYENPALEAKRYRFWYSQFLFVLAFGEAFTNIGLPDSVPGINYASRGLSLIPSIIPVEKDSLAAVETLCLAAMYLQAVDLRLMAFQLIGQGLRICVLEGWHREMPLEQVDEGHGRRCNTMFWTTYVIDREFGTLVGATSSIRDEDITMKLPSEVDNSTADVVLTLQIRLSRLTAKILTGVYGVDRNFDGTLIKNTQSVLQDVAEVSRALSAFLASTHRGIDNRTSKVAIRLLLSYHHCVVLTTRPLVMCVLQWRLAQGDHEKSIPEGPICSLLQSCLSSALNILKTLNALGQINLLDAFLPFQLETAFSSAFLLYVIDAFFPDFVPDKSWLAAGHRVFDMMIERGSPSAPLRKREFSRLEQTMLSYLRQCQEEGNPSIETSNSTLEAGLGAEDSDVSGLIDTSYWGFLGTDGEFTISPTEILNLAAELQVEDFMVP